MTVRRTSDYLFVTVSAETLSVSVCISPGLTVGVSSRAKELRRRIKSKLDRLDPASRSSSAASLRGDWSRRDVDKFQNAVTELQAVIEAFQKERLEPKVVQEALGISAREYRRWVKDGRLPKSGTRQFKKGRQIFQYFTHAHSDIAALMQHPERIRQWRDKDRATGD
jgi:hypothetical protein